MAQPQPYSPPSPPPIRYRLHGLVTTLTVLFAIFIALDVIGAANFVWRGSIFDRLSDGAIVSEGEANVADGISVGYGGLWLLLFLATAVVFIVWQYRHAVNARTLGVHGGLAHPGWAIGGWFIPLANLVLPARQIYRSSRAPRVVPSSGTIALLVGWAIAMWVSQALDRAAWWLWTDADGFTSQDLEQSATSDYLSGVAAMIDLVAAVLALLLVRMLTKRQDAAFDSWFVEEPAAPQGATVLDARGL